MEEEKLNKQQLAAAQLLAIGTIEKQDIAKQVGVSRTTLYNWLTKNEDFKAEVASVKRDFKNFGIQLIESKLVEAVNGYWKLLKDSNNDMVSAKGYEFFIERSLGKLQNNLTLTTEVNNIKSIDKDILESEFEEFDGIDGEE
ncbi:phBC6A51 family helix-turn-helix protein [Neobacillus sp. PS3-40]|uniref:phBC6A51 family helix-turn-helix protein n=1 Tax=Neobacillus sp. PS3-40 TaxID=3070679 RepID=UPI0027E09A60|nr:phBC6A51 family helix-turn-helix protein [Neobacillus sp. PS3-40]WML44077.1 phBC6A51 family helix-turn-helix protein [Neobacillus sp. PS3-40]